MNEAHLEAEARKARAWAEGLGRPAKWDDLLAFFQALPTQTARQTKQNSENRR